MFYWKNMTFCMAIKANENINQIIVDKFFFKMKFNSLEKLVYLKRDRDSNHSAAR